MNLQIETELEDDGHWIAAVPELPGALAYGEGRKGAVAAVEALALALALRVIAELGENGEIAIAKLEW